MELLIWTGDVVDQGKKHFEDLPNLAAMAESEDLGEDQSITMAETTKVVKKLLGGRVPAVDEIHPEDAECSGHCHG